MCCTRPAFAEEWRRALVLAGYSPAILASKRIRDGILQSMWQCIRESDNLRDFGEFPAPSVGAMRRVGALPPNHSRPAPAAAATTPPCRPTLVQCEQRALPRLLTHASMLARIIITSITTSEFASTTNFAQHFKCASAVRRQAHRDARLQRRRLLRLQESARELNRQRLARCPRPRIEVLSPQFAMRYRNASGPGLCFQQEICGVAARAFPSDAVTYRRTQAGPNFRLTRSGCEAHS